MGGRGSSSSVKRSNTASAGQERYAEQVKSLKRLGTMQASQIINQRTQLDRIARSLAEDEFRKSFRSWMFQNMFDKTL